MKNALEAKSQQAKDAAWRRYVELLKANSDDAAAVDELHGLMQQLGKSPADVQRDAGALKSASAILASIQEARGVKTRFEQSKVAVPAFREQMELRARQDAARLDELEREQASLSRALDAATGDVDQLNKLKTEHPELLRHVKPSTFDDLV